jgi:hypothetical protein
MSDEKRTYEASAHLNQSPRLQARRAKGKKLPPELALGAENEELLEGNSIPISQDLILRLIKLLKES